MGTGAVPSANLPCVEVVTGRPRRPKLETMDNTQRLTLQRNYTYWWLSDVENSSIIKSMRHDLGNAVLKSILGKGSFLIDASLETEETEEGVSFRMKVELTELRKEG